MNSVWGGTTEGAFFNPTKFDQHRTIQLAEDYTRDKNSKDSWYCMGVDVGRLGDMTEVVVIKVTPAPTGVPLKQIVNIYTFEDDHFEKQAIAVKRIFTRFKCDMCVVDGNGIGIGLVDYLVRDQIDPDTGDLLSNWGVVNDDDKIYKKWETDDTIKNAMYIMKANQPINSDLYAYCQSQLNSGKLKFLIDETVAKNKLLGQAQGKKMTALQRAEYLRPYVETSILKSQMIVYINCPPTA